MKKLSLIFAFLLCISSLSFAQNITVEASQKQDANFDKYRTFYWSSQVDSKLDPGLYFLNDVALKGLIRQSVDNELQGLGYNKTSQNPDLIINFRVFDKPTTLRSYSDYGAGYWGTTSVNEPRNVTTHQVQAGTLVINMVDRKTGEVVWTGFASGLMDGNLFNKNEDKIKEAVNLIFDQYDYRADGITSNK
jgi:hypothetical protein